MNDQEFKERLINRLDIQNELLINLCAELFSLRINSIKDGEYDVNDKLYFLKEFLKNTKIENQSVTNSNHLEELPFDPILLTKLQNYAFDLSVRVFNVLMGEEGLRYNFEGDKSRDVYLGDLVINSRGVILKIPNFGIKSLKEVESFLASLNLSLGMTIPSWPPANLEELARKYEYK